MHAWVSEVSGILSPARVRARAQQRADKSTFHTSRSAFPRASFPRHTEVGADRLAEDAVFPILDPSYSATHALEMKGACWTPNAAPIHHLASCHLIFDPIDPPTLSHFFGVALLSQCSSWSRTRLEAWTRPGLSICLDGVSFDPLKT